MVRKASQRITVSQEWRERMKAARKSLPDAVSHQMVLDWICDTYPDLATLKYATRWRNAWNAKVADSDYTKAVEAAASHFNDEYKPAENRLRRQNLHRPT